MQTSSESKPRRYLDRISFFFDRYEKYGRFNSTIIHSLSINISKVLTGYFDPELYITYNYDIKSAFNFVFIPVRVFNEKGYKFNITRKYEGLKFFSADDFEFVPIPNAADNSKYIKSIKNPNIRKISTQQYILKNLSRWIVPNPSDNSTIKAIYKTKEEIPDDEKLIAFEVIAKPKIMIRMFKDHSDLNNSKMLIQITRYFYNVDTIRFVNHRSKFEFTRYSLPVFIEIAKDSNNDPGQ